MIYRVLMVEDDDGEAAQLEALLNRYAAEHGVKLHISREKSAVTLQDEKRAFDLILLDIGLPGINGMEAAEALRHVDDVTPIIFITSLAQYAIKGYEVDALGFVLKPATYGELSLRLDKALRVLAKNAGNTVRITTREGTRQVSTSELASVEISNHDLVYHLMDGSSCKVRGTISSAEEELGSSGFVRISASCIANMALIANVKRDSLEMADGSTLFFSRSRKKAAMEQIARFFSGNL